MMLPALVALPLVAALVSGLTARRRVAEAANIAVFSALLGLAAALGLRILEAGPLTAWGGSLYADALSALVILLLAAAALATSIYAAGYFRRDEQDGAVSAGRIRHYYVLTPLLVSTLVLAPLANNLGVMWVAIEGATLASLFLISFYARPTSLEAAWKYAIIGGVGLSLALFGTILTYYAATRAPGIDPAAGLNWSVLVEQAARLDRTTMRLAFILILLGYGAKAGLAPMHTWKPDAYSEAPAPAAALLSVALLNGSVYCLIRFSILATRCLGSEFPSRLLILFGLLSMGVAAPFILVQRSLRRLLAYSTIDQAGILMIALGVGGRLGTLGLLLHLTYHTFVKPLLFFCAGDIQQRYQTDVFRRIRGGVIHVLPFPALALLAATLAVAGAPPFSLFQSEFTILTGTFLAGRLGTGALFLVFSAAIFAGALRHVGRLVLGPAEELAAPAATSPGAALATLAVLLVVLAVWLPAPLFELIQAAARVVEGA